MKSRVKIVKLGYSYIDGTQELWRARVELAEDNETNEIIAYLVKLGKKWKLEHKKVFTSKAPIYLSRKYNFSLLKFVNFYFYSPKYLSITIRDDLKFRKMCFFRGSLYV